MKKTKLIVAMLATIIITGCSNKPSESDAKKAIASTLPDCSYVALEDFKKINGTQISETAYDVDVSYSISIKPLPENIQLGNQNDVKRVETEATLKSTQAKWVEFNTRMDAAVPSTAPDGRKLYAEDRANTDEYKKFVAENGDGSDLLKAAQIATGEYNNAHGNRSYNDPLIGTMMDNFGKVCKMQYLAYSKIIGNTSTADVMTKGITVGFTQSLRMVKTDNGWMAAR